MTTCIGHLAYFEESPDPMLTNDSLKNTNQNTL